MVVCQKTVSRLSETSVVKHGLSRFFLCSSADAADAIHQKSPSAGSTCPGNPMQFHLFDGYFFFVFSLFFFFF